jgi:hypothetical protein
MRISRVRPLAAAFFDDGETFASEPAELSAELLGLRLRPSDCALAGAIEKPQNQNNGRDDDKQYRKEEKNREHLAHKVNLNRGKSRERDPRPFLPTISFAFGYYVQGTHTWSFLSARSCH